MTLMTVYRNFLAQALGSPTAGNAPNWDYLSDDVRAALVTSGYTPNYDTHDFWDDVVANEASGTGYTANGAALASKTLTLTAANSWGTAHATTTAYTVGQIVRPSAGNGYVYVCVVAGNSGGSAPTWPTVPYQTVADGTVTWACFGRAVLWADAADPQWNSVTITARYCVIYNRTPASDATRPLMACVDFEGNVSATNGTFTVQLNAQGIWAAGIF